MQHQCDCIIINRMAHGHFKLQDGNIIEYDVKRIEVLAKVNDKWLLVSRQGTQVAPVGVMP